MEDTAIYQTLNKREDLTKHQLTLGDFQTFLKRMPFDRRVRFDFPNAIPKEFNSYRGYYTDLALGYEDPYGKHLILENFLQYVKSIEGQVFTGYKGGDYTMNRWTPLWAANYGDTTSIAIVGVTCGENEFDENPVVIRTAYVD